MLKLSLLVTASVLLDDVNSNDPRVQQLPDWQRDAFWIVPVGDTLVRLPKPHELGILLSFFERSNRAIRKDKGTEAFEDFDETVLALGPNPMEVTALKPFYEVIMNRDTFRDKPLVSFQNEQLLPEYRYGSYTSETAKVIARGLSKLPIIKNSDKMRSPIEIDHLIKSYTGGIGKHALNLIDKTLIDGGVVEDPVRPEAGLGDIPLVSSFVARHPSLGLKPVVKFQEVHKKAQVKLNTFKELMEAGQFEDAFYIMEDHEFAQLNELNKTISDLRRSIYQTQNLKAMDGMEDKEELASFKREVIDSLTYDIIELSEYGLELYKDLGIVDDG
jgi:hypothetical protein